jgi:hypothetical protein
MITYLIRDTNTTKIQGIFWAENATELAWAVDEMGDPSCFEYSSLKKPSGLWSSDQFDALEPPQFDDFDDDEDDECGKAIEAYSKKFVMGTFGESLVNAFHDQTTLKWKRF